MLKVNCGCDGDSVEQVGPGTEEEVLGRFPDAAIILVVDQEGNGNFLRFSKTDAKFVSFPLAVSKITEPPEAIISLKLERNPAPQYIGPSGGSGVLFHVPH